jgi:hypothetical protein
MRLVNTSYLNAKHGRSSTINQELDMFLHFSGCPFIFWFFNKPVRKKMKKNLLTLMFVIAFICVGVSVASAKNASSSANSVAVSKKVLVSKTKANSLKAICMVADCGHELQLLLNINDIYEQACPPPYSASCEPDLANAVIRAGNDYEQCLNSPPYNAKNIDRTVNRNKAIKPQDVKSR